MASNSENFVYGVTVKADVAAATVGLRGVQNALLGIGRASTGALTGFGKMAISLMSIYMAGRMAFRVFEDLTRQMGLLQTQINRLQGMGFGAKGSQALVGSAFNSAAGIMTPAQLLNQSAAISRLTGNTGVVGRTQTQTTALMNLYGDRGMAMGVESEILKASRRFAIAQPDVQHMGAEQKAMQLEFGNLAKIFNNPQDFRQFVEAILGFNATLKENISNKGLDKLAGISFLTGDSQQAASAIEDVFQKLQVTPKRQFALMGPMLQLAGVRDIKSIAAGQPFGADNKTLTQYAKDPTAFIMDVLLPKFAGQYKTLKTPQARKLFDTSVMATLGRAKFSPDTQGFIRDMMHLMAGGQLGTEYAAVKAGKAFKPQETVFTAFAKLVTAFHKLASALAFPGLIKGVDALTGLVNKLANFTHNNKAVAGIGGYGVTAVTGVGGYLAIRKLWNMVGKVLSGGGSNLSKAAGTIKDDFGNLWGDPGADIKGAKGVVTDIFGSSRGVPNTWLTRLISKTFKFGESANQMVALNTAFNLWSKAVQNSNFITNKKSAQDAAFAKAHPLLNDIWPMTGAGQAPINVTVILNGTVVGNAVSSVIAKKIINSTSHLPLHSSAITPGMP